VNAGQATGEHRVIALLADRLLDRAVEAGDVEVLHDGAWVHSASCRGFCDYACGAIWIGFSVAVDGQRRITEVANAGLLQVELEP
jgi:hypothetical protein